ncbi:histidine kinase [Massilia sp. Root418]|jgi:PAS domain S-box-containing protein|uniref:PAS domain-containing hybrid sensor histidine kinase/response regulator n=1 Tax=Massilia sp. Root418 TaxID=1736532 RepID=UPI0006FB1B31|nr:PAS domain-containing hybrid sensor histidine kinase/response regulator [Massilia sp. Root418]KQW89203.1 histidine kinase [Massilia sp. Root418]
MQYARLLNLVQRALGAQDDAEMQQRLAQLRAIGETTLANGLLALLVEGERADPGPGPGLPPQPQPESEEDVRHRQELTEQILDQLPIPVFLKDREGHFLRFNKRFEEFTQRTREEILGRTIDHIASPRWAEATRAEDSLAWRSGRMVTSERRLMSFDPPRDVLVSRSVINSGGRSYMLGYFIDISEQRAARDAMQRAVESAEAASRAKSEFLANMSHEVRTPMNGILGMTELVLESGLTPEQRADIGLVKASADALLAIVNDILDFSKIEAGKLDLEDVPFDLRQMVQDSVRVMALRARQKGLALRCELPASLPRAVKGDPGRLRQVLINLIGNAIKFTAAGSVTVAAAPGREDDQRCDVTFSVTDTGIGIPLEKQKLIFEAFAQVDGSTTREYGGTGLGLTICRRLVILMQGQIGVFSAPGAGSTFSFTVPLRHTGVAPAAPLAVQQAPPRALPVPEGGDARSGHDRRAAASAGQPGAPAEARAGSLRVLLAEDNAVNQRLALRLLEKLGHRATLVDSGVAALEYATGVAYDAVLMDVQMPGLDGLAAARHIRLWEQAREQSAEPGRGRLPIIAMTARAMAGDRERCLEAGMDGYLSKPISLARLREALERCTAACAYGGGRGDARGDGCGEHGGPPVLDWQAALQRLDGDAELLRELAALFLQDGPQLWRDVADALAAQDVEGAARAVHSLKGVLMNFGAARAIAAADSRSMAALEAALQQLYAALCEALAAGAPLPGGPA